MEHIKLFLPTGAFGFDVHALEQVGITLRIEDDDHLMFDAMNVLSDVNLGEPGLANAGSAQHQGMSDPFT
ncbi:hypothetical protein D3C78_1245210 [compost metagenome]